MRYSFGSVRTWARLVCLVLFVWWMGWAVGVADQVTPHQPLAYCLLIWIAAAWGAIAAGALYYLLVTHRSRARWRPTGLWIVALFLLHGCAPRAPVTVAPIGPTCTLIDVQWEQGRRVRLLYSCPVVRPQ